MERFRGAEVVVQRALDNEPFVFRFEGVTTRASAMAKTRESLPGVFLRDFKAIRLVNRSMVAA